MSRYYIMVDNPFGILLDKQQKLLTSKHPNISLVKWNRELEIRTDKATQEEALLQKKDEKEPILPVTGSWNHRMKWVQEKRYVGLRGYGINYLENLRHNPEYSMLQITLG